MVSGNAELSNYVVNDVNNIVWLTMFLENANLIIVTLLARPIKP